MKNNYISKAWMPLFFVLLINAFISRPIHAGLATENHEKPWIKATGTAAAPLNTLYWHLKQLCYITQPYDKG